MLDHISIPVADLSRSSAFYDPVLRTLGLIRRRESPAAIGYGLERQPAPVFWLLRSSAAASARSGPGLHISFEAPDRSSVDAFFETAIANGGRPAGAPGSRPAYTQPFYGAFVIDLDGFKIEAVCRKNP